MLPLTLFYPGYKRKNISQRNFGFNMSLKVHFMHSHLHYLPEDCREVADEHKKRFHQEKAVMK